MVCLAQNVINLPMSVPKIFSVSDERIRQRLITRKQELLKAHEEISTIKVLNEAKTVAVNIGSEYFVHYAPKKALAVIDRMISAISNNIVQHDQKQNYDKEIDSSVKKATANDEEEVTSKSINSFFHMFWMVCLS